MYMVVLVIPNLSDEILHKTFTTFQLVEMVTQMKLARLKLRTMHELVAIKKHFIFLYFLITF